jgi:hypothetical protein
MTPIDTTIPFRNEPFADGEAQIYFDSNHFRTSKRNKWALYTITFANPKGDKYEWIPEWERVQQIYTCAAVTEIMNEGTLLEQARFAHTAISVVQAIVEETTRRLTNIDLSKETRPSAKGLLEVLRIQNAP